MFELTVTETGHQLDWADQPAGHTGPAVSETPNTLILYSIHTHHVCV